MRSDRRGFFKNVAGMATAVAGAHALRTGTGSGSAAYAAAPPSTAGRFVLDLGGEMAGHLITAEGGHASAEVITQAPGQSCLPQKNIGPARYGDITLSVATGMSAEFYEWMQAVIECQPVDKDGAIITTDFNYKEVGRQEFVNALITEIGFPSLDASSKDPAAIKVSFSPELTRRRPGKGNTIKPCTGRGQRKWLASDFRLNIDGLDCTKVQQIGALVIKQPVTAERIPGRIEYPNLTVTLPESAAQSFFDWHEDFVIDGNSGSANEKKGQLEFLAPNRAQALFTIDFRGLGIFSLVLDKLEAGADPIRRVTAEMYCEEMTFNFATSAVGC
jgi:hypothetical protein